MPNTSIEQTTVIEVVQHLRPGGLEHLALDLAQFAANDRRTYVVSIEGTAEGDGRKWDRLSGIADKTIFMNKRPGLRPGLIRALARLFKKLKADAVHTHHLGPLLYGGLAARLAGVPRIVHTEHNAWHLNDRKHWIIQAMALGLARPTLVADAGKVADALKRAYPCVAPTIIMNGIDTERFLPGNQKTAREKLGLPEDVQIVGCAARLEPVKGHEILLNALSVLPVHIHLALAGDGSLRNAIAKQAADLGLSERVHLLGRLENTETFYQALDLFCLPSLNEGLPLAPLEAQACGVPCVLTDVGACGEAIDLSQGSIVAPGNSGALAQGIVDAFAGPMGSPRNFIQDKFDVRTMVRAYEELYV